MLVLKLVARSSRLAQTGRVSRRVAVAARLAMAFLVLVAFTAQAVLTQTHIHVGAGFATIAPSVSLNDSSPKKSLPTKSPAGDDPANCPICQGLAHVGFYVAPSLAALTSPSIVSAILVIHADYVAITRLHTHGWKSRAPPPV